MSDRIAAKGAFAPQGKAARDVVGVDVEVDAKTGEKQGCNDEKEPGRDSPDDDPEVSTSHADAVRILTRGVLAVQLITGHNVLFSVAECWKAC